MTRKLKFIYILWVILIFSCGLDVIIYLESPTFISLPSSGDPYLQFRTTDKENLTNAPVEFLGFDVFYLIYKNKSTADSEQSKIESYKKDNPSSAAKWLFEEKHYKKIKGSISPSLLIKKNTVPNNRDIKIRLYDASEDQGLYLDGTKEDSITRSNDKSFVISNIQKTDEDVFISNENDTEYHAVFYGVTTGILTTFNTIYSELLYLGTIELK